MASTPVPKACARSVSLAGCSGTLGAMFRVIGTRIHLLRGVIASSPKLRSSYSRPCWLEQFAAWLADSSAALTLEAAGLSAASGAAAGTSSSVSCSLASSGADTAHGGSLAATLMLSVLCIAAARSCCHLRFLIL